MRSKTASWDACLRTLPIQESRHSSGDHAMPSVGAMTGPCGERPIAARANQCKSCVPGMEQLLPGFGMSRSAWAVGFNSRRIRVTWTDCFLVKKHEMQYTSVERACQLITCQKRLSRKCIQMKQAYVCCCRKY